LGVKVAGRKSDMRVEEDKDGDRFLVIENEEDVG